MDAKTIFQMLHEWLTGIMDLLAALVAIGVLCEIIFGTGVFGVSVVKNLTTIVGYFGTNGFAGLLALLILIGLYKHHA